MYDRYIVPTAGKIYWDGLVSAAGKIRWDNADRAPLLLIGGGMSYTFLAARGYEVSRSLLEADQINTTQPLTRRTCSWRKFSRQH